MRGRTGQTATSTTRPHGRGSEDGWMKRNRRGRDNRDFTRNAETGRDGHENRQRRSIRYQPQELAPGFGVADVHGRGRLERRKTEHQEIRGERIMMGQVPLTRPRHPPSRPYPSHPRIPSAKLRWLRMLETVRALLMAMAMA